jgi:hypothetical protein
MIIFSRNGYFDVKLSALSGGAAEKENMDGESQIPSNFRQTPGRYFLRSVCGQRLPLRLNWRRLVPLE